MGLAAYFIRGPEFTAVIEKGFSLISPPQLIDHCFKDGCEETWFLTVSQKSLDQKVIGIIDKENIEYNQYVAEHDLEIETEVEKYSCDYLIRNQHRGVYEIGYVTRVIQGTDIFKYCRIQAGWPIVVCDDINKILNDKCGDVSGVFFAATERDTYWCWGLKCLDVHCYKGNKISTYGSIEHIGTTFESKITMTADDKEAVGYISSDKGGTVELTTEAEDDWGEIQADVAWVGSLHGTRDCASPQGQDVVAMYVHDSSYGSIGWRTTDENDYEEYKRYGGDIYQDSYAGFELCLDKYYLQQQPTETPDSCASKWNNKARETLDTKSIVMEGGRTPSVSGKESQGQIKIELTKLLSYPVLTIYAKGMDWLGIYQACGVPQIEADVADEIRSGSTKTIEVDVKNIGEEDATFDVWAECTGSVDFVGQTDHVFVEVGDTEKSYLPISASCVRDEEGDCTIKARSTGPGCKGRDEDEVTTLCKAIPGDCTPGEKKCGADGNIDICNEDEQWEDYKDCKGLGCAYDSSGDPYCKVTGEEKICDDGVDNDGDALVDCKDPDCEGEECQLTVDDKGVCKDRTCVEGGYCIWWNPLTWGACASNFIDDLKERLGDFFEPLKILGGIIAGVIGFVWSFDWTSRAMDKKIALILSAIIALCLALIVYFYLIWGIIILVIYLVIKSLLVGMLRGAPTRLLGFARGKK